MKLDNGRIPKKTGYDSNAQKPPTPQKPPAPQNCKTDAESLVARRVLESEEDMKFAEHTAELPDVPKKPSVHRTIQKARRSLPLPKKKDACAIQEFALEFAINCLNKKDAVILWTRFCVGCAWLALFRKCHPTTHDLVLWQKCFNDLKRACVDCQKSIPVCEYFASVASQFQSKKRNDTMNDTTVKKLIETWIQKEKANMPTGEFTTAFFACLVGTKHVSPDAVLEAIENCKTSIAGSRSNVEEGRSSLKKEDLVRIYDLLLHLKRQHASTTAKIEWLKKLKKQKPMSAIIGSVRLNDYKSWRAEGPTKNKVLTTELMRLIICGIRDGRKKQ
jgi:hypothetical protein